MILGAGSFTPLAAIEPKAEIAFSNVSDGVGISRGGVTFGSSWGAIDDRYATGWADPCGHSGPERVGHNVAYSLRRSGAAAASAPLFFAGETR